LAQSSYFFRVVTAYAILRPLNRHVFVEDNVHVTDLPALSDATMSGLEQPYNARIRPLVHHNW
jgi:hypothetical protein